MWASIHGVAAGWVQAACAPPAEPRSSSRRCRAHRGRGRPLWPHWACAHRPGSKISLRPAGSRLLAARPPARPPPAGPLGLFAFALTTAMLQGVFTNLAGDVGNLVTGFGMFFGGLVSGRGRRRLLAQRGLHAASERRILRPHSPPPPPPCAPCRRNSQPASWSTR